MIFIGILAHLNASQTPTLQKPHIKLAAIPLHPPPRGSLFPQLESLVWLAWFLDGGFFEGSEGEAENW
jgi:hypothetical protein